MNRVVMEYRGKKTDINLTMKYLKEQYLLTEPGCRVSFDPDDSAKLIADNPGMFKVIGIEKGSPGKVNEQIDVLMTELRISGSDGKVLFEGTIRDLCAEFKKLKEGTGPSSPIPTAEDMLKDVIDEPEQVVEGDDYKRDASLTGDGIEGTEETPLPNGFTPCDQLAGKDLISKNAVGLRDYMKARFNFDAPEDMSRAAMLKDIKDREAQAGTPVA